MSSGSSRRKETLQESAMVSCRPQVARLWVACLLFPIHGAVAIHTAAVPASLRFVGAATGSHNASSALAAPCGQLRLQPVAAPMRRSAGCNASSTAAGSSSPPTPSSQQALSVPPVRRRPSAGLVRAGALELDLSGAVSREESPRRSSTRLVRTRALQPAQLGSAADEQGPRSRPAATEWGAGLTRPEALIQRAATRGSRGPGGRVEFRDVEDLDFVLGVPKIIWVILVDVVAVLGFFALTRYVAGKATSKRATEAPDAKENM